MYLYEEKGHVITIWPFSLLSTLFENDNLSGIGRKDSLAICDVAPYWRRLGKWILTNSTITADLILIRYQRRAKILIEGKTTRPDCKLVKFNEFTNVLHREASVECNSWVIQGFNRNWFNTGVGPIAALKIPT